MRLPSIAVDGVCQPIAHRLLVEATSIAGGSANTEVTPEGFAFDQGGHVVFSHSKFFDDLIQTACVRCGTCLRNAPACLNL
jgi:hypothetical protein